ncbi:nitroreductase [Sphingorhabdus sp. Alg239-R122]|uniref:nitroreductase n=1 Tax=Sphingorhabdus sp. Alg239-R122 TaxID=2305989 RepID=UPI0013DC8949|nr:nitroreductase [Sphingorhabdus sp. Alg239-R122]
MNVSEAVRTRRSVRAFTGKPVDLDVLKSVLDTAQLSPSGGNVQPWNASILTGDPLAQLISAVAGKLPQGPAGQSPEYDIYPKDLPEPYRSRRYGVGEALYESIGIDRGDKMGRMMQMAQNFRAFEAPVCMFVHTPGYMGPPQWSDIGMWLQTIMLLLREAGLDSCAQEAWSLYGAEIREAVNIPEDHIFFCGMAIGCRDVNAPINNFAVPRAEVQENITYLGFPD